MGNRKELRLTLKPPFLDSFKIAAATWKWLKGKSLLQKRCEGFRWQEVEGIEGWEWITFGNTSSCVVSCHKTFRYLFSRISPALSYK